MNTYFTPMLRTSMGNKREYYIEEFPKFNPLKAIHARFNLFCESYEAAENKAYDIIEKQGGRFIGKLPLYLGKSRGSKKRFKVRASEESLT